MDQLSEGQRLWRRRFIGFLRVECGLAGSTIEAYARDLETLMIDLRERGIDEPESTTPEALIAHIRSLTRERGYSGATVARHIATIRVFYRWILANGAIESNPAPELDTCG